MTEIESKRDEVPVTLSRVEAMALLNAAEVGVRVIEALRLVQRIGPTETSVNKLRAAVAHAGMPAEPPTAPIKPASRSSGRRASGGSS